MSLSHKFDLSLFAEDGVVPGDPTEVLRFPVVNTLYPSWSYITAVYVNDTLWPSIRPTDTELLQIASFHEEYCTHWFGDREHGYNAVMRRKAAYDLDGGANTRMFAKTARVEPGGARLEQPEGAWRYRLSSWRGGPTMVPFSVIDNQLTLVQLMDRISSNGRETPSTRWAEWKAAHPDVFPTEE